MSIVKNAMIVNLQVGLWTGFRLDKEASLRVTSEAHAQSDRVNYHLVPKETLKPIQTAAGAVRLHFYAKTLPWKDNGDRLLTRKMYMQFIEEHEGLKSQFDDEVEHFLKKSYLAARDQAEFRMGELFDRDDYPTPKQLKNRFYINMDVDAVTEAGDFRVDLDKEHLSAERQKMEQAMEQRIARAMGDLWGRLSDTLGHFAERTKGDKKFKAATIHNLEEIVDMLPALNVTNDPDLARITKDIKNTVIGYKPEEIREDKKVRKEVSGEAKRIMDEMRGIMSAFGGKA
jgi:hypothetical protein